MNYFALCADGNLYDLGDHGDFECADNTASDLQINQIWVFDEKVAKSWATFINKRLKENQLAISKL